MKLNNTEISQNIKNKNITINSIEGAEQALKLIKSIDDKTFYNNLVNRGFNLDFNNYKKIKVKTIRNLEALNEIDLEKKFIIKKNYFETIDSNFLDKEVKLVFLDHRSNLEICDFKLQDCKKIKVKSDNIELKKSLLGQNFSKLKEKNIYSFSENNHYLFCLQQKIIAILKRLAI